MIWEVIMDKLLRKVLKINLFINILSKYSNIMRKKKHGNEVSSIL